MTQLEALRFMDLFRSGKSCVKVNDEKEVDFILEYMSDKTDVFIHKETPLWSCDYVFVNSMGKYKEIDGFDECYLNPKHFQREFNYIVKDFSEFKDAVESKAYYPIIPQIRGEYNREF